MALQLSVAVRNAMLDAIETAVGSSAVLKLYDLTATAPADCAAAITGTVLATLSLPLDWMAGASGGSKALTGTWSDAAADGTGTADFFRLFASDGTTCHAQGTVSLGGGGGDMTLATTSIVATQGPIAITGFTLTAASA